MKKVPTVTLDKYGSVEVRKRTPVSKDSPRVNMKEPWEVETSTKRLANGETLVVTKVKSGAVILEHAKSVIEKHRPVIERLAKR
ncbi:hypothetical protein [Cupriavidus plantarum]|uniref:hypothetical protein n=1 Tax=Cupriavidus plantarum TaxID=942865 RepID=UPI000EADAFCB|nr:hypothetical protein [Cupriavidus plantarum]RLK44972.1 hypothetical protein C7417_0975 [Cupriavidus plantarum]